MTDPHAISALRRKRAEIGGHIHDLEKRIARQRANLANLDATIKLFSPGTNPDAIPSNGPIGAPDTSLTMNCPGLRKTPNGQRQDRSGRPK
jgi:hypothetical protein